MGKTVEDLIGGVDIFRTKPGSADELPQEFDISTLTEHRVQIDEHLSAIGQGRADPGPLAQHGESNPTAKVQQVVAGLRPDVRRGEESARALPWLLGELRHPTGAVAITGNEPRIIGEAGVDPGIAREGGAELDASPVQLQRATRPARTSGTA